MTDLFRIPTDLDPAGPELLEILLEGPNGFRVERILSHGHTTPEGFWYDQDEDEWVAVLEGEARILFQNGREVRLEKGGALFLPAHAKHRVTYCSSPCIWLAVFGNDLTGT